MVRSVAGDLPEQVKNNQSVNMAAGNGGQKMSQYSWFTVYEMKRLPLADYPKQQLEDFSRYVFGVKYAILTEVMARLERT